MICQASSTHCSGQRFCQDNNPRDEKIIAVIEIDHIVQDTLPNVERKGKK